MVDITVRTRTRGVLTGYTVDISESGISAMLRIDVPLSEIVELNFTLPIGQVKVHAIVRQRDCFRYGFQFLESAAVQEMIRTACRQLSVERSLCGRALNRRRKPRRLLQFRQFLGRDLHRVRPGIVFLDLLVKTLGVERLVAWIW